MEEKETIMEEVELQLRQSRAETVAALRARDGRACQHPECGKPLDFKITEENSPLLPTIDHWIPKSEGVRRGWTYDEIWDLSNLKLMHKCCNAKKGDLLPNEDGTIPEKPSRRKFRYRRDKRAQRPEFCDSCDNGHNLAADEVCAACGANAKRFPRWAKVSYAECDHAIWWCWICSITPEMRTGATEMILIGDEGGDED